MSAILQCDQLTKLYGIGMGVNDLTFELAPGIHGLLGPNGAGKSTFLKLLMGQLRPTEGTIRVLGEDPWNNPKLLSRIGYCPEHDAFWGFQTGLEFVTTLAELSGVERGSSKDAARDALARVGALEYMGRPISSYSKGMRQRTKLAQALVHEPPLLVLDEPLSGTDPIGRREIMDLVADVGASGKSVIVASHVMHEVQTMTSHFLLIYGGRILAAGDVREIRKLMYQVPHRIRIVCDRPRELASNLSRQEGVEGLEVSESGEVLLRTREPRSLFKALPEIAAREGIGITELGSEDESLDAVFEYLVRGGI